jgi:hypothetical protein
MEDRAPYWQQLTLTSGGDIQRQVQPEAQAWIHRLENDLGPDGGSDRALQSRLMALYGSTAPDQAVAAACLHNFITHILYQRCVTLAQRFGQGSSHPHGPVAQTPFTAIELFCCVFAAPLPVSEVAQEVDREFYDPLTAKILATFDPSKGSLSSWCLTCLRGSRAVKRFLREHGIVLETDWQLLCRIRPGKLQRLLTAADCASSEITTYLQLLSAFHHVYRSQLEEQRRTNPSRRPYPAPTEDQLMAMGQRFSSSPSMDASGLLNRLKQLAQYVRQDRCRGPSPRPPAPPPQAADPAITQLLESYCQPCLAQAVEQTIEQRLGHFQQKRRGAMKANQFLQALTLFYCHSQPMKEIAVAIGLRDQPSVSRLLNRDALQADIRRQVVACLLQRIRQLATATQSPERLQALDQQIAAFIDPYVEGIIAADQREGYTSKHRQMTSAYATQLCHCATHRRNAS